MTSNKEFISQTKETLAKMGSAEVPQFNPYDGSFRKLLGIKEDEMVPLSFVRSVLNAQIPDSKNIMTVNNTFKH